MKITKSLKPTVFLATSIPGLELAYAIQENLDRDAEIVLWWETFSPGALTFESLSETLKTSDFVIIALSSDDLSPRAARDDSRLNLVFQTGLYVGELGLARTFLVIPTGTHRYLPADLSGVNFLLYDPSSETMEVAIRQAAGQIRKLIRRLGFRERKQAEPIRKTSTRKKTLRSKRSKTAVSRQNRRSTAADPRKVFISYSHKDKRWLEKLRTLLVPSVESKTMFLWDDSMIKPGEDWKKKVETALASARVALLLVSPDFLASRFISQYELPPLLDAAKKKGIKILWIYLRASDYKRTAIAKYQAAHDVAKPLKALNSAKQDQELLNIVEKINEAASTK